MIACDSEEINFIDENQCDIIVGDNCDSMNYGKENDNQDDSDNSNNMQQIVIKSLIKLSSHPSS